MIFVDFSCATATVTLVVTNWQLIEVGCLIGLALSLSLHRSKNGGTDEHERLQIAVRTPGLYQPAIAGGGAYQTDGVPVPATVAEGAAAAGS